MSNDYHYVRLGRWTDGAVRNLPRGPGLWHGLPRRAHTFCVIGHPIGVIRYLPAHRKWIVRVEGFEWPVGAEHPQSRFWVIPGGRIEWTSVTAYPTGREARAGVEAIWQTLPSKGDRT